MKSEYEVLHTAYARALFAYGEENTCLDVLIKDYEDAVAIFEKEKLLAKIMKDPRIDRENKEALLDTIKKEMGFSEGFINFTKLLIEKKRFDIFHGIFLKFRDIYNLSKRRMRVFLYSSAQINTVDIDKIRNRIEGMLGKDAVIESRVDEELIGGIRIRFEDRVYDGSIKRMLECMKEKIAA